MLLVSAAPLRQTRGLTQNLADSKSATLLHLFLCGKVGIPHRDGLDRYLYPNDHPFLLHCLVEFLPPGCFDDQWHSIYFVIHPNTWNSKV